MEVFLAGIRNGDVLFQPNPNPCDAVLAVELGIWRELSTGKRFCTEVTYQKQVALLSVRMQQTNNQRSGVFETGRNPPSKPVLASTWVTGIARETPGSQM